MLRLADAPLLPFEFGRFASTVLTYVDEIEKGEKQQGHPNLTPIRGELDNLKKSASNFDAAFARAINRISAAAPDKLRTINELLYHSERTMTIASGLPHRDWYKHTIYAPGTYTGYGVKTLPGIREAVEADRLDEAGQQTGEVVKVLKALNAQIQEAEKLLSEL
jgi:N-acetylated-alpha-linked acidic dipeptidase